VNHDDETQFREFVSTRFDGLRRLAYLTCGNWSAAEDAVANVLAKLYVRWGSTDYPDVYVRTMVIRSAIDETRRPWWRRERPASGALPERAEADPNGRTDERLRMWGALRQVPTRQRSVLVLRFYEGLSVRETAVVLGCGEGNVKSQTARGLVALRRALEAEGLPPLDHPEEDDHELRPAGRPGGRGLGRPAAAPHG
jgi:RNA polymerase sigma-70 factor (sigma-E family)